MKPTIAGLTMARLSGVIEQIGHLHEAIDLGSSRPPQISVEKCKEWGFAASEINTQELVSGDQLSEMAIRAAVDLLRAAGQKSLAKALLVAADDTQ